MISPYAQLRAQHSRCAAKILQSGCSLRSHPFFLLFVSVSYVCVLLYVQVRTKSPATETRRYHKK